MGHLLPEQGSFRPDSAAAHRRGTPNGSAPADDPSAAKGLPEGVGIGDPDHLVRMIRKWEDVGVTGINFLLNAMEMIPQQQVLDSLRLFATEVIPQFRTPEERGDGPVIGRRAAAPGARSGAAARTAPDRAACDPSLPAAEGTERVQ